MREDLRSLLTDSQILHSSLFTKGLFCVRGDVQALGFRERVAGAKLAFLVAVFNQGKFSSVDSRPCRLHLSDGFTISVAKH